MMRLIVGYSAISRLQSDRIAAFSGRCSCVLYLRAVGVRFVKTAGIADADGACIMIDRMASAHVYGAALLYCSVKTDIEVISDVKCLPGLGINIG